jgi:PAP2 superfamily
VSAHFTTTDQSSPHVERFGLARCDVLPTAIVLVMAVLALAWNLDVGIEWRRPWVPLVPVALLLIAFFAGRSRQFAALGQTAFYSGLWMALMVLGIQLTYLANTLAFPLRDQAFERADLMLGFHWLAWIQFVDAHHWFSILQWLIYETNVVQPFLCVGIFTALGRRERNAELLTAILIGLILTIGVSALLPAIGPADAHGIETSFAPIIRALRSPHSPALSYEGIVSFPSFHTVMAILFTYANRGIRRTFVPFLVLNGLMLLTIPYCGQHYLVDIAGGAIVAAMAIAATRRLDYRVGGGSRS